jgi:hypothetical protein
MEEIIMYESVFSKSWDNEHGFTHEEAMKKKAAVDDAHGVYARDAKWNPAVVELDPYRKSGYRVVIRTKK